jgi:hypothetical protein
LSIFHPTMSHQNHLPSVSIVTPDEGTLTRKRRGTTRSAPPPPAAAAAAVATFTQNWGDDDVSCFKAASITAQPNTVTLLGPPHTKGLFMNCSMKHVLVKAVDCLRRQGGRWVVREHSSTDDASRHGFLWNDYDYHGLDIQEVETGNIVARMDAFGYGENPWIAVTCHNGIDQASLKLALGKRFSLASVKHEEAVLPTEHSGYEVTVISGGDEKLGTLFQMKKLGVVVGKALCAYENSEIEVAAPILERFEIASEWQGQHQILDHLLLKAIEDYYRATFCSIRMKESPHEVFLYYAPYRSLSPEELELFQTNEFCKEEDGEAFCKSLLNDSIVRQYLGTTRTGASCKLAFGSPSTGTGNPH